MAVLESKRPLIVIVTRGKLYS